MTPKPLDSCHLRTDLAIFVATSGHSGVDRIIANLLPEFSRAGLRVDLLRVRNHGPWIEDLPPGARAIDLQRNHVTQSLHPLTRYLRENRPRVLLSDKDRANRTALRALRRAKVDTRCFLRLGTTASANLANKGFLDASIERRSLRRYWMADGVIVPSTGAAEDLAHTAGLAREHIHVLPNPVITPEMERATIADTPAPHAWLTDDARLPVVLACGSLTPRKDYTTLIKAFAELQRLQPSRLLILGRGSEHERLTNLADRLEIGDRVEFPGFVDDPIPWMRRASVFAHTSQWEGLGIVLIEALACGTPVVAMNCPSGPAEVLDHGRYGTLVSLGDTAGFTDALAHAITSEIKPDASQAWAHKFTTSAAATAYLHTLGLDTQYNHQM
ncbi:MAG: glycosyltransferase [Halofilum sp. (in: g-proteobacteria)]|nr:glycosyltransferase [Halofilum sp. (in: g-proteobacteria)]